MAGGPVNTSLLSHGQTEVIINNWGPQWGPQGPPSVARQAGKVRSDLDRPASCLPWLDIPASLSSVCLCLSCCYFFPTILQTLIFSFFLGTFWVSALPTLCANSTECLQASPVAPVVNADGEESPFSCSVSVSFCSRRLINPQEKVHLDSLHAHPSRKRMV